MHDVNGWLMVLSFSLGLVLTLAFTVRRVTCEVPVHGSEPASGPAESG